MSKYRKKPVVIDAVQWTGTNTFTVMQFMGQKPSLDSDMARHRWDDFCQLSLTEGLTIFTLEDGGDQRAKHVASVGDWIIKGVQGEFYPCKPDIFAATYEPADDEVWS